MPITTIIFDFGGVITSSPFEAFNRLETERGVSKDSVRRVNSTNPNSNAWARFERAEIDAAEFDRLFTQEAQALGINGLTGSDVLACLAGDVRPAMVAALDELKGRGFTLGCITNNVPSGKGAGMALTDDRAAEIAAIMERFDHVIESSKVGVRKPDPRIYQMMCEALCMELEQCVYLDDLGINCKPAAALGMQAIKVTSGEQALEDLERVLDLPKHSLGQVS
ncbi:HAD-IA family hydrolase [Alterisphingorhabdus coralli]|uniref:HAD-IA family hydrolase n=1 Tax=Alterisphingorhabdus coralli TaxID=3071408 RepID=A0AA97I1G8_9SPHN|nr:HAD-IA family hydrolase [Parasphingorhabdus sp. SCSIO 66989]WOE76022.1 HAD-IA family hydrolase [Parasphingorhabdus sp. SCSIO 66989]